MPQENTSIYPVMEHFYTLQGEGYHTGKAAYFVRLGGCNVGCVWCDVKESWNVENHSKFSVLQIEEWIKDSNVENVVITGGEPAMYNLTNLCAHLKNFNLWLETSGAYHIQGDFDWICFSPKKFKKPTAEIYTIANELKVVIYHPSDIIWAEKHAEKVNKDCKLYLQPEWSKKDKIFGLIIDYIKTNPKWTLSLQTHKYLNIP
jgi:organic radical activating enzyme